MTLKSALEDLKGTTLAAVCGLLGKLAYLASLRRGQAGYEHWGIEEVHGREAAQRALRMAHREVVSSVLRMPLRLLVEDVEQSCGQRGVPATDYIKGMQEHFEALLPGSAKDSATAQHLSSVLVALSSLKETTVRAIRSAS